MSRTVLAIPGDGIGPEVLEPSLEALSTLAPGIEVIRGDAGLGVQRRGEGPVAADTLADLHQVDAVLFGATTTRPGDPSAVLTLRRALGLFVTERPARTRAGLGHPDADLLVVRELTEDLYVQEEAAHDGGASATSRITEAASRRVAAHAWDAAGTLPGARCTVAHKATILPRTQGLFLRCALEEAVERGLTVRDQLVDSLAHDLVRDPRGPHVILAPNVWGDILSDVASALTGGLGLAASASHGDGASLFEPVHGSAPDIAGRGIANPTAALRSTAMMLQHLGLDHEAQWLDGALDRTLSVVDVRTPDLGGTATTRAFTDHVLATLEDGDAAPTAGVMA